MKYNLNSKPGIFKFPVYLKTINKRQFKKIPHENSTLTRTYFSTFYTL